MQGSLRGAGITLRQAIYDLGLRGWNSLNVPMFRLLKTKGISLSRLYNKLSQGTAVFFLKRFESQVLPKTINIVIS